MTKAPVESELVEAIARRVVELLRAEEPQGRSARLVDAATLARELGVERDWVYVHAEQLGAIRLGGPHGRLRFDRREVTERLGGAGAADWRPPRRAPRRQRRPDQGTGRRRTREVRSTATAKNGRGALERPRPDTGR